MKRFLCLYLPRWPLQRLYTVKPETRGKAVALFERSAHGPRLVVCSVEANKRGVKRGMLLADATALAPDLLLYEADYNADREALEKLALWAGRFSPLTGLENTVGAPPCGRPSAGQPHGAAPTTTGRPQALLADITGCTQVFHGEKNIVRQALQGLARKNLKARAAIAPTIGAAWALAHYGANGEVVEEEGALGSWLLALGKKPTTEIQEPGAKSQEPASLRTALAPLPLPALRLDNDAVAWLNKLGLYRIADVLKQPRSTLPSRFGPQLLERLDQALGAVPELLALLRPAPEFHATTAFEYLVKDLERLDPVIEQLVSQLAADMHQRCRGARAVECWLYQEMGEPLCAAVTLHKPSASLKHLLQLLRTRLETIQNSKCKIRNDGSGSIELHSEDGICAVTVRVMSSEPLDAEQLALFHQALRTPESLAMTLDRIHTRLGKESVLRPALVEDPQPEDAVKWATLEEPCATAGLSRSASIVSQEPAGSRPLQLLLEPLPIAVYWPRHSLRPLRFEWRGEKHLIKEASGPERIETGWWKEAYARRDYYLVETSAGGRYWIFQRRDDEQWFLHGVFG
ncbi:MAG: DNA polymerase Y family protein [Planctomycetota bacterium]|nr:DNA polymerase Y family protein [Planctomycetota bacterium]